MKHLFTILTLLLLSTHLQAQTEGDSWATVKANRSGTLNCVYGEVTGLLYQEDNEMKGLCVDLLFEFSNYIKTKYDVDLKIKYAKKINDMSTFIAKVQSTPNLLGVRNTSITEQRKKILDFSPPFLSNPAVLLSNSECPNLNSLDDIKNVFQGYTAIAIKGTTHMAHLKNIKANYFPALKIESVNNRDEIFERLSKDNKVFTSVDFLLYFGAFKMKLPVKRHKVEIGNNTEALGFVLSKGSDWTPLFEEFLTPEFRQSYLYKQIVTQNIGSSFLNNIR